MKICPKCKSRTVEEYECPICGESIAYEEKVCYEREKIKFNRYYLLYLFRNCAFTVVCLLTVAVINIIRTPKPDSSYVIIYGIIFVSLIVCIFKRTFIMWNLVTCNDRYATFTTNLFIIACGVLSVVLAAILW